MIDTDENLKIGIQRAGEILLSGGSVAFPTESFYGLGVNAMDDVAVGRLFHIKGREHNKPVLILLPSIDDLQRFVDDIPARAVDLMREFWPGGLTMIFYASKDVSPLLIAGTGKIGVRLSGHPVPTAIANAIGGPVTGTSANISGRPSCVTADDVKKNLGEKVDLILDGGRTEGGKGSTVLDITTDPPKILRKGMISREQLKKFLI